MFETVVVATDGSASGQRAVTVALDLAAKFDATVHALSVVDADELETTPEDLRAKLAKTHRERAEAAVEAIGETWADRHAGEVVTAVREGVPEREITAYAREHDADVVATGTRGRHGEHRFLLGSVAEAVVRTCPVPVLTVRQLEGSGAPSDHQPPEDLDLWGDADAEADDRER